MSILSALWLIISPLKKMSAALDLLLDNIWGMVPYFFVSVIVVLLFWLLAKLAQRVVYKLSQRSVLDESLSILFSGLTYGALLFLGLLVAAMVLFPSFNLGNLVSGLGLATVAVGIAFQSLFLNAMAYVLILLKKPFSVGHIVRVNQFEGTIDSIFSQNTILRTFEGERIVMPNAQLLTNPVIVRNYNPSRRREQLFVVDHLVDMADVRKALRQAITSTEGVLPEPEVQVQLFKLLPYGAQYRIWFWVSSAVNATEIDHAVNKVIKQTLDEQQVSLQVAPFGSDAPV